MENSVKVTTSVAFLRNVNQEQIGALRAHVLGDGLWNTCDSVYLWMDGKTVMVTPKDASGASLILIGIEPDGYTHS